MNPESANMQSEYMVLGKPRQGSLIEFWRSLIIMILLILSTFHTLGQLTIIDTTSTNPQQGIGRERLGARLVIGGVYARGENVFVDYNLKGLLDVHPVFYGVRFGALLPMGVRMDFMAVGEYTMCPRWTSTTYSPDYNSPDYFSTWLADGSPPMVASHSEVPGSVFTGFRMGVRFYPRFIRSDDWVARVRAIKRQVWRRRVNRSGFHAGGATGPVIGWHKRVTRTLPENWPQNEPIPESALLQGEQLYTRWYWNTSPEVGWTFWGRVDVSLGLLAVVPLQGSQGSSYELASAAYTAIYFSGSLSCVLGRTKLRAQ